jgi:hypothetical protein
MKLAKEEGTRNHAQEKEEKERGILEEKGKERNGK